MYKFALILTGMTLLGACGLSASPAALPAAPLDGIQADAQGSSSSMLMAMSSTMAATPGEYVPADPPVTGVTPSSANPSRKQYHEFQANCAVSRPALNDDPIVFPGQTGMSHLHSFLGNTTTDASSTVTSLSSGATSCSAPGDLSAYWYPTLLDGSRIINPVGPQIIYYKSGVIDYTSVKPFPKGLRFVVGSASATEAQFKNASVGWACGNTGNHSDIPATCPVGSKLLIRYRSPSCWDGLHLDSPDHKSHMAYPVSGRCPADHPVALPMLETKFAFSINGDLSGAHLSSGRGYSFHYDFFNVWDPATQKALVDHCIVGGLQCDARGYDDNYPNLGAALGTDYRLH